MCMYVCVNISFKFPRIPRCMLNRFSCVQLVAILWTVARQAPLSTGFLQARILERVAISSARGSSRPRDRTHVYCVCCSGRILYHLSHQGSPADKK